MTDPVVKEVSINSWTELFPLQTLDTLLQRIGTFFYSEVLVVAVALQWIAIIAAFVPAIMFAPKLRTLFSRKVTGYVPEGKLRVMLISVGMISIPVALYLSLALIKLVFISAGLAHQWLDAAIALLSAWIVVRLVTLVIQSPFWSKLAFYVVWPIAVLDIFGVLNDVMLQLQSFGIPISKDADGEMVKISLLDALRTLLYFVVLFWFASTLSKVAEKKLNAIEELSPAIRALILKILNVLLPVVALMIALQIAGFNLATLAVFSGAVGLGLGLGLQRIVANFVAGFTLIADRSIKPGDTIEIDGVMGWVMGMHSRYVAIKTRDGTEILIPNDRFMSEGVINWSRSDNAVRQHAGFGVAYTVADLKLIQRLAIEAATAVSRVVADPQPVCHLIEYGDSSVNFDLCYWIRDPQNGIANVKSDVMMELWDMLKEHDIEIPFPQRDLHIKSFPVNERI